ncbi:MAG: hypothetical protein Q7R85_04780 [bacterium]|nr:hypothetical protein [bacterium]
MAIIWFVVKDTGGTNGAIPVVCELRKMGHVVTVIANTNCDGVPGRDCKGIAELVKADMAFVKASSAEGLLEQFTLPDAVVTDTSTGGGVGRDLIPLLPSSCVTFALQDYWGGCLINDWADPEYRPSYIIVGDTIGAETVRKAWPEFNPERIGVTGYPALDKYADPGAILAEAERFNTHFQLGFVPTVFYAGSTLNGQCLMELVKAIETTGRRVNLIVRPHPRMIEEEPNELPVWGMAVARLLSDRKSKVITTNHEGWSTPSLIAAADVTISAYSTCLLEAAALLKQNITLWTPEVRAAFMSKARGFGGVLNEFPLVTLGCTVKAESVQELGGLLRMSFADQLDLRAAQKRHYPNDGKNAFRAAEFIHTRISR